MKIIKRFIFLTAILCMFVSCSCGEKTYVFDHCEVTGLDWEENDYEWWVEQVEDMYDTTEIYISGNKGTLSFKDKDKIYDLEKKWDKFVFLSDFELKLWGTTCPSPYIKINNQEVALNTNYSIEDYDLEITIIVYYK